MRKNRRPKIEKISVAVIGEGPTEWHYFNDLRQTERLRFSLKPSLPKSSNFRSIIQKAKQFAREGYDYVYCVIDLDYIMITPSIHFQRYTYCLNPFFWSWSKTI
ncbi:MAG: RloB domain-containing protein [Bacteroidales bacterium]